FSGTHGVRGNADGSGDLTPKYNLLVDDAFPPLKAANTVVEKTLVTGKALDNTVSITQVTSKPDSVVVPLVFNAHNLSSFLRLFFQDGVTWADGVTNSALEVQTNVPYSSACPVVYGNLVRFKQDTADTDDIDQVLHGVVPSRILIRGEEGGLIEGEVEFLGAKWEDYDLSSSLTTAEGFDTTAPLKFEDLTIKIAKGAEAAATISVPAFEIVFENDLVHQYYNETSAQQVSMGRMRMTGNLTIPFNDAYTVQSSEHEIITNFRNGTMLRLSLVWGANGFTLFSLNDTSLAASKNGVDVLTANAKNSIVNNYLGIHALVRILDYDETEIDLNPMVPIDFKALEDDNSTVSGVSVYCGYDKSKNTWQ
ncbi:MAG: hypothetical protein ACC656_03940, partial [Candidatus Heimdallarchaeota archaeon]